MRRHHSLGDTDGVGDDAGAQLRLHGLAHHQVDAAAQDGPGSQGGGADCPWLAMALR